MEAGGNEKGLTSGKDPLPPAARQACREAPFIWCLVVAEPDLFAPDITYTACLGGRTGIGTHITVYPVYDIFRGERRDLGVDLGEEISECLDKVFPLFLCLAVYRFWWWSKVGLLGRVVGVSVPCSLNLQELRIQGSACGGVCRVSTYHSLSLHFGSLSLVKKSNVFCDIWPGGTMGWRPSAASEAGG